MTTQKGQQEIKEIKQEPGSPEKLKSKKKEEKVVPGNTHIFKTYPEDLM